MQCLPGWCPSFPAQYRDYFQSAKYNAWFSHAPQRENTPTLSKYSIDCLAQKYALRDTPLMFHNNTPAVIVVVLIIQLEQFPFSACNWITAIATRGRGNLLSF